MQLSLQRTGKLVYVPITLIFIIVFRDIVEDKYIDIQYIQSDDNPVEIMTKNTLEAYIVKYMKRIIEGELWELVDTGRDIVKNAGVKYDVINRDKTEYSSHARA